MGMDWVCPVHFHFKKGGLLMSWVVWDTSYLQHFYTAIKTAIGNATNIGLIIFAIIIGVLIAIAIVRKFTKT